MNIDKVNIIDVISFINKSEYNFKVFEQNSINNLNRSNELVEKVNLLLSEKEDEELLAIKEEILSTNKDVRNTLNILKKSKFGHNSFFSWRFVDLKKINYVNGEFIEENLIPWLNKYITKGQNIVFAKVNFEIIQALLKDEPESEQVKLDMYVKINLMESILFISGSRNSKGKETAYLYMKNNEGEKVLTCKTIDVISAQLLNIYEDLDLDVLNNLRENNELSSLYSLACKEALDVNLNLDNTIILNQLEEKLDNFYKDTE